MKQKILNKNKIKKNNGITLIALVITIIVLLILAAVSIAMLTGQNGILSQAQNAKNKTIMSAEKETLLSAYNEAKIKAEEKEVEVNDLKQQLDEKDIVVSTEIEENELITVIFNSGRIYRISCERKYRITYWKCKRDSR